MTKSDVLSKRNDILLLARQHGAASIKIFGSVVRGEEYPDSDVDFLVQMENGRSLFDMGGLLMDLQDLLGCKVDVVSENGLRSRIKDHVLREAMPI
jgi:predicted nucleotidyltransferase